MISAAAAAAADEGLNTNVNYSWLKGTKCVNRAVYLTRVQPAKLNITCARCQSQWRVEAPQLRLLTAKAPRLLRLGAHCTGRRGGVAHAVHATARTDSRWRERATRVRNRRYAIGARHRGEVSAAGGILSTRSAAPRAEEEPRRVVPLSIFSLGNTRE